jgi:hypothetical protein
MGILDKLGVAVGVGAARESSRKLPGEQFSGGRTQPDCRRSLRLRAEATRVSNGLKEFLWNLDGLGHGTRWTWGPLGNDTLRFLLSAVSSFVRGSASRMVGFLRRRGDSYEDAKPWRSLWNAHRRARRAF